MEFQNGVELALIPWGLLIAGCLIGGVGLLLLKAYRFARELMEPWQLILSLAVLVVFAWLPFNLFNQWGTPQETVRGILLTGGAVGLFIAPIVSIVALTQKERPLKAMLYGVMAFPTVLYVTLWFTAMLGGMASG